MDTDERVAVLLGVEEVLNLIKLIVILVGVYRRRVRANRSGVKERLAQQAYSMIDRVPNQIDHMRELVDVSDITCIENLRMDRHAFCRLCFLLENVGGLARTRHVQISEQVAIFLSVLAHHKKTRIVKFDFKRSGFTISKHFNRVLHALLCLYNLFLFNPDPVDDTWDDDRWKWFKGCLGALDGTYINVRVALSDKARYRNRKGNVSSTSLQRCDQKMLFTYVLSGWEGSAADSRVFRDAVARPNGLRVPTGKIYLCDCGYTNGPGFLAPYRGVRYHLDEWGAGRSAPQNSRELFNLRHSKARNVIERTFGLLNQRWAILRSNAFYPIKTQNRIIMGCCLLHNFIRTTMSRDPLEDEVPDLYTDPSNTHNDDQEYVDQVESSPMWTNWRDELAMSMYNEWRGSRSA
ncbi:hypothetical protein DH2020_014156 [Rehmannia glutinosa]|uniref:DDE Tnp4 domain-containing protein n=1 Tax=Rehmannia glutinosa TaxID=99300 RepID=A0ABR0WW56_REHGL